MTREGQEFDRKSLRYALGKHEDAASLSCDCVGLVNGVGGVIHLGIEDDQTQPPTGQRVPDDLRLPWLMSGEVAA